MEPPYAIEATDFSVERKGQILLDHLTLQVPHQGVTVLMGPANAGKGLMLRCINRLAELEGGVKVTGHLRVLGQNVYDRHTDPLALRRQVAMVFRKPSLITTSVFENVAVALRMSGIHNRLSLAAEVEETLKEVNLWDCVRQDLSASADTLTLEQQQRLCLARVLVMKPAILLMDQPMTDFDPPSVARMEMLIRELGKRMTVVVSTKSPQQAAHIGDYAALFFEGRLVEAGRCEQLLTCPMDARTEAYVTGKFG